MKLHTFSVLRRHDGDREYHEGDTRELAVVDATHLIRAHTLEPKGAAAVAAVEDVLGPKATWGVQAVPVAAPTDQAMDTGNAKAAADGASPRPAKAAQPPAQAKADIATPAGGTVHAGEPGVAAVAAADLAGGEGGQAGADAGSAGGTNAADGTTAGGEGGTAAAVTTAATTTTAARTGRSGGRAAAAKATGTGTAAGGRAGKRR